MHWIIPLISFTSTFEQQESPKIGSSLSIQNPLINGSPPPKRAFLAKSLSSHTVMLSCVGGGPCPRQSREQTPSSTIQKAIFDPPSLPMALSSQPVVVVVFNSTSMDLSLSPYFPKGERGERKDPLTSSSGSQTEREEEGAKNMAGFPHTHIRNKKWKEIENWPRVYGTSPGVADFYIERDMETEGGEGEIEGRSPVENLGPHGREGKERFKRANVSDLKRGGGGCVSSSVRFPICAKEGGGEAPFGKYCVKHVRK